MLGIGISDLTRAEDVSVVADRLLMGRETVKSHLRSIYRKLGVSDRTGAVATALREGIYQ